jgi:hypothetical protein
MQVHFESRNSMLVLIKSFPKLLSTIVCQLKKAARNGRAHINLMEECEEYS